MSRSVKQRGVQSIETGGEILSHLANHRAPMMLRDLAAKVGTAAAQLHPYLVSFKTVGMVEQTPQGLYQLGPLALNLGLARLQMQDGYRDTLDRVDSLAREMNLMVSVSVWGLHGPVITYVRDMPVPLHANVRVGGHYGMTNTATGHVFASLMPPQQTEPVIAAENCADRPAYRANVAKVRAQGYAITQDIPIPGVSAIAAPVRDHTGQMLHCVTLIGPSQRINLNANGPHAKALLHFTTQRSHDLGFRYAARAT